MATTAEPPVSPQTSDAPPDPQPDPRIADAVSTASAADKDWWRRKNHGGTGA